MKLVVVVVLVLAGVGFARLAEAGETKVAFFGVAPPDVAKSLQKCVDQWLENNPGYQPIRISISVTPGWNPTVAAVIFEKAK